MTQVESEFKKVSAGFNAACCTVGGSTKSSCTEKEMYSFFIYLIIFFINFATMIIIRNSLLPFKRFTAMNLFGIVLCRKETTLTPEIINHERIHTAQLLETGIVGFYIWYVLEWLIKLPLRGNAYRRISFEREAYLHMDDSQYLQERKRYSWWRLLRIKDQKDN